MKKNLLKMLLVGCIITSSVSTGVFASTDVNKSKENKVEQTQMLIDSLIDDANKAGKDIEDKIDALNNKIDEMQSEDNEIMEKVNKYEQDRKSTRMNSSHRLKHSFPTRRSSDLRQ